MFGVVVRNGIEIGHVDVGSQAFPIVAVSIVVIVEVVYLVARELLRWCLILILLGQHILPDTPSSRWSWWRVCWR